MGAIGVTTNPFEVSNASVRGVPVSNGICVAGETTAGEEIAVEGVASAGNSVSCGRSKVTSYALGASWIEASSILLESRESSERDSSGVSGAASKFGSMNALGGEALVPSEKSEGLMSDSGSGPRARGCPDR